MEELLALAEGAPRRAIGPDEVLLEDGAASGALFVLLEGRLHVRKGGVLVSIVGERGSCVGEMSLLLGVPVTATVVAAEPSVVAVIEDAPALLGRDPTLATALAQLLARRLQSMTTYLVDLKQQYAGHEGGLGMVDVVLDSLMQGSGGRTELRSARDPDPEF
jgi:CRP-like cAMP-binding protein